MTSEDSVARIDTDTAPSRSGLRRAAWWLLAASLAALLCLALAIAALSAWLRSASGFAWLLQQVPGLEVAEVQGSPFDGGEVRIGALSWIDTTNGARLQARGLRIAGVQWVWRPDEQRWFALQIGELVIEQLHLHPATTSQPTQAPPQLRLPFEALLERIRIGELQYGSAPVLRALSARLHLGAQGGAEHRLDALSFETDHVRLQGQARIGSDAPLPLNLRADIEAPAWSAHAQAQGALQAFEAKATLRGQADGPAKGLSLDAQARIEPFEAWPLAGLQLIGRDLDLSTLWPGWPRTRIAARARVSMQGLDQAATVALQFDNTLPGPWDAGRLPVASLAFDLGGTPQRLERLRIGRIDLRLADEQGPAGQISGQGEWVGPNLQLRTEISAMQPARLHGAAARLQAGGALQWQLTGLPDLARAREPGAPRWDPRQLALRVDGRLSGPMDAPSSDRATATAGARDFDLELQAQASSQGIEVERAQLRAGAARASAQGGLRQRAGNWTLQGEADFEQIDPAQWWRLPWLPARPGSPSRLHGRLSIDTHWSDVSPSQEPVSARIWLRSLVGQVQLSLRDSLIAGVAVAGELRLLADRQGLDARARIEAAGNTAQLSARSQAGAWPWPESWRLQMQAPRLETLAPWAGIAATFWPVAAAEWPQAGHVDADFSGAGPGTAWSTQGRLRAGGLHSAAMQLAQIDASWNANAEADAPLALQLKLGGWQREQQRIDALSLRVDGSRASHRIELSVETPARPPAWVDPLLGGSGSTGTTVQLQAQGRWQAESGGGGTWRGQQGSIQLSARQAATPAPAWLDGRDLEVSLRLDAKGKPIAARLAPGRASLAAGAALRWQVLDWADGPGADRIEARGELETLAIAPVLAKLQPELGWSGDLRVGARIAISAGQNLDAELVLERNEGDLGVRDESGQTQTLGLTDLRLGLSVHDGLWQFTQGIAGQQLGEMAGAQVLRTDGTRRWPPADAPLQGVLQMRVASLHAWGAWVPPGWRLGGSLNLSAALAGRFGAPEFSGQLRGESLAVRNLLQGVNWSEGELAASLVGDRLRIDQFSFKGGDGRLVLSGGATLGEAPAASLQLKAERFRILGRIDRRLTASGQAELSLRPDRLELNGRLDVDDGLFEFSRADAPSLDSDVNIIERRSAANAAPAGAERAQGGRAPLPTALRNAQVNLQIGLGEKLVLRGRGLDTQLRGDLRISSPGGRLAINGTVRAHAGTYVAYGQKMEIQRGEVAFSGPVDNPRLDIRAVRPNLDVVVGVTVTGTANNPRVRLFSEPEMSEIDKLSWLVLGRSPAGLGRTDTALLQRAAVALLSGEGDAPTDSVAQNLGLTDFSLRQSDGEVRETVVSLGRQLSRRWYVGYERSVNATTGTWQLIYRIAQRFTLRAQSGQENSLDLIWTWRW